MCVIWNRQGKLGKIILFTYQQGYRHRDTGGYQEFFRLTFSHCSKCQSTHCIINWPRSSLKAGCHSSWRVNLKMPWKHQQLPGNLCTCVCVCVPTQSCPTLQDAMDWRQPGSSVHGVSQERILEWVAISYSRECSWSRDWTHDSSISCIGMQTLYHWATWEAQPVCISRKCHERRWKWKLLSHIQLFVTPWTIQSMEFSRPEYWSG